MIYKNYEDDDRIDSFLGWGLVISVAALITVCSVAFSKVKSPITDKETIEQMLKKFSIDDLESMREQAVSKQNFEKAAKIRDVIALKKSLK